MSLPSRFDRLMVIVPDRLTDLVNKGEVTERYYNPGNLFGEVHLVMTNDDVPDPEALRVTVGDAKLVIHNLPAGRGLFFTTLAWRPWLLRSWGRKAVALARKIRPDLIRCHGARLNAYAAACIKERLGVPYVVSMHMNPDEEYSRGARGLARRFYGQAFRGVERIGLAAADGVLPVYRDIVPYLQRVGVQHCEVCYNALNPRGLSRKEDYRLHDPVKVVSVGRQLPGKNPENIIRAVSRLPGVQLSVIGDGPLHDRLRAVARESGAEDRVEFRRSIANDDLCRMLPEYDLFAVHNDYRGVPKAVLEPLLTGLPVVVNRRDGQPISELTEELCLLVDNTVDGYGSAFAALIADHARREALGRAAYAQAQAQWAPEKAEAKYVAVYRRILGRDH